MSDNTAAEAETAYKLALAHHRAGRLEQALKEYARTVRLSPYAANAYNNFGVALRALGRVHAAVVCYRRALAIRPRSPGVLTNLGNAFRDLGLSDRAIEAHSRALKLEPNSANANFNAALALRDAGRSEKSLSHLQKALALDPGNSSIKVEMGISLLMAGQWREGFRMLEHRLAAKAPGKSPAPVSVPVWRGESLQGKTLLVTTEGNPGTEIMMARFARQLEMMGASVVVEASGKALPLLELVPDIARVVAQGVTRGDTPAAADFQVALMSIPERLATTVETVPRETPYIRPPLATGPGIGGKIGPGTRLAVGLEWTGAWANTARGRNCPLADLLEIISLPGLQAFSLAGGAGAGEIDALGMGDLLENPGEINDLAEMARIIEELDLVITTNGAAAHVAGALGKPVWLMLEPGSDWCWLLDREDSPWYPSMRIFRMAHPGAWPDVAARVRKSLGEILAG